MKKHRLVFTAMFLFIFTGMVLGQASKVNVRKDNLAKQKNEKAVVVKADHSRLTPANMDPGFVLSVVKPTTIHFGSGAKSVTAYAWNAYGGTIDLGACTVDIPSGTISSIAVSTDPFIAGADWADGVWYGVQYMASPTACPLVTIDPATGLVTVIGGGIADLTGMAYDVTTSTMYAMDYTGNLFTMDISTGATTLVALSGAAQVIGLAADNAGMLYAIGLDDNLYKVTTAGVATVVGPLGIDIGYAQDIAYDRDNEILYGTLYNATTSSGGLYQLDVTSGTATLLADFVSEVDGFAIPYSPVPDDAPGAVTAYTVVPDAGGALTADVDWINPTLSHTGLALTELTSATLLVNNNPTPVYQNTTPTIGGAESYTYTAPSAGFYKFTAYGSNTVGDGDASNITVWIGEDVPAAPGSVTFTNPSGMDATVTWTAPTAGLNGGYFSGLNVTYDVIRYPGAVLVSDNQTGLTFTETIANPGGNFYYTVTASNNSGVGGTATSNVLLIGDFIIYEDFELSFPNTGWSTVPTTAAWAQATGTVNPSGIAAHSPVKLAYFNSYSVQTGTASLITPSVNIAGIPVELSYWMYHESGYPSAMDNVQLKMSTDGGTTWTNVGTPVNRYSATDGWVKHSYIISTGSATTKFDFFATSAFGNDIHIDDVICVELTGCIQPSFQSAIVSDISAILDWTENSTATAWEIEWGTEGFTPGSGTTVSVTSKPYTLNGLTAYTSYDYYVRSDCGSSSYSPWIGPFTFTTSGCPAANQCTYTFTVGDSYNDGWNGASITVNEDGHDIGSITCAAGTATGSIKLCLGITVTLTWVTGSFDEECSFTLLDPSGVNVYSFIAGNAPIAGVFSTFTACPTCPAPTALTATGMTLTSGTLGWTPSGSETLWNIQWGTEGFTFGTGTTVSGLTSPSYAVSGLTTATGYDFYVQADCGSGDLSSWAGPFNFHSACGTISTFQWFDDFESGIDCYTISGINTAETWFYDAAALDPYSGVANITCEYDPALAPADEWIKSPVFDLTSLTDPQITFFWNMSYYWAVNPYDNYDVFLKGTTDGVTWTDIWTEPIDSFTNWTWYDTTMSLAAFNASTTFQFAFNYKGADGAAAYIDDITIDNPVSANNVVYKPLLIYPNPTTGILYINETVEAVEITDMLGQVLITKTYTGNVDLSGLKQGVYFVKMKHDNHTYLQKITLVK